MAGEFEQSWDRGEGVEFLLLAQKLQQSRIQHGGGLHSRPRRRLQSGHPAGSIGGAPAIQRPLRQLHFASVDIDLRQGQHLADGTRQRLAREHTSFHLRDHLVTQQGLRRQDQWTLHRASGRGGHFASANTHPTTAAQLMTERNSLALGGPRAARPAGEKSEIRRPTCGENSQGNAHAPPKDPDASRRSQRPGASANWLNSDTTAAPRC